MQNIGQLHASSTLSNYGPRVDDWMLYNGTGAYDWREVTDAKVCAFAGWLYGRSKDKCLNGWTSANNSFFDLKFGCRPFNTHTIKLLKREYRVAQLARTMRLLGPDAMEPKEQRIGTPYVGVLVVLRAGRRGL